MSRNTSYFKWINLLSYFQKKRLSIATSSDTELSLDYPHSMGSVPTSPLSTNFSSSTSCNLSSSLANMSLTGNGVHSGTESQSSSKTQSPASSVTSTLTTISTKQDRSATPSGDSDREKPRVCRLIYCLYIYLVKYNLIIFSLQYI